MNGDTNIDNEVNELSEERKSVAFQRALKVCGIPYTLASDGLVETSFDEINEHEGFLDAFGEELKMLVVKDTMDKLVDDGILAVDRVDDDGDFIFKLTDEARKSIDDAMGNL